MEAPKEDGVELEIREHSDADFPPKECPSCRGDDFRRHTYNIRVIQDLGTPRLCRRIRYERVYFKCKACDTVFTIEHPLVRFNSKFMPGVVEYAVSRVCERSDSIRRVTKDLNDLHHVDVSVGTVENWVNERKKGEELPEDFGEESPPSSFSGFVSVDGTFKSVKLKKNDLETDR